MWYMKWQKWNSPFEMCRTLATFFIVASSLVSVQSISFPMSSNILQRKQFGIRMSETWELTIPVHPNRFHWLNGFQQSIYCKMRLSFTWSDTLIFKHLECRSKLLIIELNFFSISTHTACSSSSLPICLDTVFSVPIVSPSISNWESCCSNISDCWLMEFDSQLLLGESIWLFSLEYFVCRLVNGALILTGLCTLFILLKSSLSRGLEDMRSPPRSFSRE